MQSARFVVSGVVQGVWYRASTREQALALGLRGHARNRADGSVEVIAAGNPAALDTLERWLWQGPPTASVVTVVRTPCPIPSTEDFVTG
ncbi:MULTISPECIES: acylphosphatase [Xanthomonas]|uniref:acylphosphatase n=1 Tax=Xanthomonas cucurbitae TaxID=56453 RepID=A0A2S7DUD5_9XANT|nr:acylphosphatase [Xanthomonas cucurbitae]PPU77453.1 acylphosphatase [Xanthomonas cucurbitae]QHG86214.1 acylphosphatase [Xanthomonas cucurbitae]WDM68460.1 acylphosphatase [Xanthomonas cucurbitae]WDM72334.1 acylphosphatase [Xanthomonas cucurbitae]WDM76129.1 acylphosphatase [Xanthomonas cucurbitae]